MSPLPPYVDYEIRGKIFRVPEAYLGAAPPREQLGQVYRRPQQFGAAFWLSDLKPSPVRIVSLSTYWPKAPGRPSSGDEDFVIIAPTVTYFPPGEEKDIVLPAQRLRNTLNTFSFHEGNRTQQDEYGLVCYRTTVSGQYDVMCTTPPGADPEVLLRSSWDKRDYPSGPPNPTLSTNIFSKQDGLSIFLAFPESALRRWSDVVCQTLTLIRSWEVPYSSRSGCFDPEISQSDELDRR